MNYKDNKAKREKKLGRIVAGIFFTITTIVFIFHLYKQYDISKNKAKTTGKIIECLIVNRSKGIIYEYYVNNVRYTGEVGTSIFRCDDGTKCCIGKEFTVYYSSKNPQYSRIDLGKYEKHKTTVEFIK